MLELIDFKPDEEEVIQALFTELTARGWYKHMTIWDKGTDPIFTNRFIIHVTYWESMSSAGPQLDDLKTWLRGYL